MGSGSWSPTSYYSHTSRAYGASNQEEVETLNMQDIYHRSSIHPDLDPKKVVRECCDTDEHPNTVPVILALDVTGSMGDGAEKVAKKLNEIMTSLYDEVKDIEFCIMAIGDLSCDDSPLQVSQFESDVRIAEAIDKVYFEGGGGGNAYESYSLAWYFGLYKTKLDCYDKRGRKGIIITLGDEPLNPHLPKREMNSVLGDSKCLSETTETAKIYEMASEKFDIYHISVDYKETAYRYYKAKIEETWKPLLGNHYKVSSLDKLPKTITDIIISNQKGVTVSAVDTTGSVHQTEDGSIGW